MAANTKIQWTTHTFNPFRGCSKVSPGCANCYAEATSKRNPASLGIWGPNGKRVVAAESSWREVLRWDKQAAAAGERHRVFCASLADVFEDWTGPMSTADGRILVRPYLDSENVPKNWLPEYQDIYAKDPQAWKLVTMADVRKRLFDLIVKTENLDWLLLTKRPENIQRQLSLMEGWALSNVWDELVTYPDNLRNLWLGVSVEDQERANERIPILTKIPANIRFLSCEPMLGPIDLTNFLTDEPGLTIRTLAKFYRTRDGKACAFNRNGDGKPYDRVVKEPLPFQMVIVGGESGAKARGFSVEWAEIIQAQCEAAGVAFFLKQLGQNHDGEFIQCPKCGKIEDTDGFDVGGADEGKLFCTDCHHEFHPGDCTVKDKKGGDPDEWPERLRVRELPVIKGN